MDFIYVDDVINCVMNTFSFLKRDTVNLSSGVFTSLSSLAKLMIKQAGYKNDPEIYFLRNNNAAEKEGSKNEAPLDNIICQLPTKIERGVEIVMKGYLEKERDKISKEETEKKIESQLYSSYKCLGGSQLFSDFDVEDYVDKFPAPGDPSSRVCHFKNICLNGGKMQYFKDPQLQNLPLEFTIDSFRKSTYNMFQINDVFDFRIDPSDHSFFNLEIEIADFALFSNMVINQSVFIDNPIYSNNFGHM